MAGEVPPRDPPPRETTIIRETRSGGSAGWAMAMVLILVLIAGVWFFTQGNRSEVARDKAVTAAANNVGQAARDVGQAARDAASNTAPDSNR